MLPVKLPALIRRTFVPYLIAIAGVAGITMAIGLVVGHFDIPNVSMVYLLLVLWLGARYGSLPATVAGLAAFVAYDFFFVPPRGTLLVSGPRELLGLVLLLAAALVTGRLAASLRQARTVAEARAVESGSLYEVATVALRQPEMWTALNLVCERARAVAGVEAFSLVGVDEQGQSVVGGDPLTEDRLKAAAWAFERQTAVGAGLTASGLTLVRVAGGARRPLYLPLKSGIAVIEVDQDRTDPDGLHLLAALVSLGGLLLDSRAGAVQLRRATSLEASDSLKAAVLSSLSHELKSPLAALRAGLTSLLNPAIGLDREHLEMVAGLDRETARLDRLVGELLLMSRLEAGHPLQMDLCSFPEICGAVLERLAGPLAQVRMVLDLPPDLPPVPMDELQVDRVLTNLLENAAEFVPPGGRIELGARVEGEDLLAWVENDGPMIPAADLGSIFDRFWTGRAAGTGLGLAICRRVVESHGGRISVSNRRSGPRFTFTLPLVPVGARR
ncbi:MAG: hypothetical protein NVS9B1_02970 [Candidatus Dormibacteraceae bacterium]